MFLLSEQIKKEAQHIIADDIDNDILLIVAHNGVGKTKLLKEIYGSTAFNHHIGVRPLWEALFYGVSKLFDEYL